MKKIKIFLALVGATLLSANALAETEAPSLVNYDVNGDGTVAEGEQAYELKSADDLYWFANYVNQLGDNLKANAILANDIVVNTLEFKDGEIVTDGKNYRVWTPIGNYDNSFQGTFDGNGKTISGLYFDNSDKELVGLFGWNVGAIKNVGVVESYFKGQGAVGGVCGFNNGTITNCYNTGVVSGGEESQYIGGVCGCNEKGTITNCYNTGEVSGSKYIGGVSGENFQGTITNCYNTGKVSGGENSWYIGGVSGENYQGTITNCYNTGVVSGGNESYYIGGVCGYNEKGTITNCYNTGEVSGNSTIGGVCGYNHYGDITNCYYLSDTDNGNDAKTQEQFNNGFVAYKLSQGDNGGVWGQDLSNPNSLPTLYGSKVYYDETNKYANSDNGFLTDNKYEEPRKDNNGVYLIANAGNLYWFADFVNQGGDNAKANAVLTKDIVVNENVLGTNNANVNASGAYTGDDSNFEKWAPINGFAGKFHGQGHTISGLYFNDPEKENVGLFGSVGDVEIDGLGLVDSYFGGSSKVGGFVGNAGGTVYIRNSYNSSVVRGPSGNYWWCGVGGFVGAAEVNELEIENSYNLGFVTGGPAVGGLVGIIWVKENFSVSNSYNAGDVKGTAEDVGGLVGYVGYLDDGHEIRIVNSYNTGSVCGVKAGVGGLVGYLDEWSEIRIVNSYNTGFVNGDDYAGGLVGGDSWGGVGYADVYNSYNAGFVNGGKGDALGFCGDVDNFYYLEGSSGGFGTQQSAKEFADGTVAQALRDYDKDKEEGEKIGSDVWGQYVGIDETPTLRGSIKFGPTQITEGDYAGFYALADADDLYWFANHVNQGGDNVNANAILTDDIVVNTLEFKDGEIVTDGKNYRVWTPIGYFDSQNWKHYYYAGTFDGKGHTISGLYINEDNSNYIGLFSEIDENSTIKNVGVVDSYFKVIYEYGKYVGSIVGSSKGKIINCYSNSTIVAPKCNNTAGGICGYNNSSVQNCYFVGSIICNDNSEDDEYENVGGICGWNDGGQFVKCYYLDGCCKYTNGYGSAMTIEQFNSGEVAYNFGGDWGQDLSTQNTFPVLNGKKVYKYDGSYTNEKITDFDENGFYEISDGVYAYQEPEVIDGVFQIANAGNLYWFAEYVNDGHNSINAVLTNDIVVNENVLNDDGTLNTFMEWTPIGYSYYDWDASKNISMAYQGKFDGQGHIVSGLYLNNSNQDYVSLFGYNEGTIQNVGVVDSYFYGKYYVGGVCGKSDDNEIKNCFSSATVIGDEFVGGVCGFTMNSIVNCYNIGSVSGTNDVGGVVGYDFSSGSLVKNCYTTGIIREKGIKINKVLGYAQWGDAPVNCYYLADTEDGKGGMTAEQFASGEVAYKLGDAFYQKIGEDTLPVLNSTHGKVYLASPCIAYSNTENAVAEHEFGENGFCTVCGAYEPASEDENGVYQIANAGNLYWFANFVNQGNFTANAILTDDIVVNTLEFADGEIVTDGKDYKVWSPIGPDFVNYYQGTFDGNGHTISGLYFNDPDQDFVGLFGCNKGTIQNAGVVDSYFYGKNHVGGVCGENTEGKIENCYNTGNVNGSSNEVGGVCGDNAGGTITICYNTGNVNGSGYKVGGVCGCNVVGTIANCYNTGNVNGSSKEVGGVCGDVGNYCTITNCYNTGEVNGSGDYVGGVCGDVGNYCTITNCYNTGNVKGSGNYVGGVCGENWGTITNCYYLETSANTGIGKGDGGETTAKTAEQFANGTVAKLLFASDSIWGQNTSTDTVPNFSGKIIFTVSVTASGNGTVSGTSGEYEYNSKFAIEATSNKGYHFAEWSNGSAKINDTILVVSDTALVAKFEAHSFGKWDTTLVATCTVAGLRTHACACGEVEIDTIPALGHKIVVDSAVAATCTVAGLTEGKHCSLCDSIFVAQQTIAKLAHTVVVDSAVAATCTKSGLTEGKHCSVCDSVLVAQQTLPALGHKIVVDSAKTATCTIAGLTEGSHCSVCDSIFVAQQTIPALGHKIETIAGVSSTCTAEGLTEGSRCSVCGEVIKAQETIPMLEHSFTNYIYNNDATYEADGTETAECDREGCNAIDVRTAEGTKLTDIAGETANAVAIYAHHNVIVVENAEADIYVYDVTGRCIEMRESCPSVEIAMQREGIYIVRTGDNTQRVFVAQN